MALPLFNEDVLLINIGFNFVLTPIVSILNTRFNLFAQVIEWRFPFAVLSPLSSVVLDFAFFLALLSFCMGCWAQIRRRASLHSLVALALTPPVSP